MKRSEIKQSQEFEIVSLYFISLAMAVNIFVHVLIKHSRPPGNKFRANSLSKLEAYSIGHFNRLKLNKHLRPPGNKCDEFCSG
jgi:hypothetical protein